MKKYIAALLCAIFFTGCNNYVTDKEPDTESYLNSIENINFLSEPNDKMVYFGRPTCPSCEVFDPILKEELIKGNKKIYYFNTDEWRENKEFESTLKKYDVNSIPYLVYIKSDGSFEVLDLADEGIDLENKNSIEPKLREFLKKI